MNQIIPALLNTKNIIKPNSQFFIILVIWCFFQNNSFAQTRADSLEFLGTFSEYSLLQNRFDKLLNTFNLNNSFQYYTNYDRYSIKINNNFNSTFIRNDNQSTRDENHFSLNSAYRTSKKIKLGFLGTHSYLTDNRQLGINQSVVSNISIFGEYRPTQSLSFAPFAGYGSNEQNNVIDNGAVYGLEALSNGLHFGDFTLDSELRLRNEDVLPRRNLIRYFYASALNNFERNIFNDISGTYSTSRKDFYFNADSLIYSEYDVVNNIQSRTETNYQIRDRLSYDKFLEVFSLDLTGLINWRNIDRDTRYRSTLSPSSSSFDTKIEELRLELDALSKYKSDFIDGAIRFNFAERDEKHSPKPIEGIDQIFYEQRKESEEQKNNYSKRLSLSVYGDLKFSRSHRLSLSFYQSKLRYDTPSQLNNDDRDEILSILRLRYLTVLSPYFTAFINAEGTYGHIVYVFAERSSNNNENRIIRLKTGGDYRTELITSFNSFEVSANYTVYDYEDITANYQSFSFRQFTAVDSTRFKINRRNFIYFYGYVKLSEQGDFNWDDFSSRPSRYLRELYLEPRFILLLNQSSLSVGLRYFSLNTYSYTKLEKIPDTEFSSVGPIVIVELFLWKNLTMLFNGYYEFINTSTYNNREQANLIVNLNWKF